MSLTYSTRILVLSLALSTIACANPDSDKPRSDGTGKNAKSVVGDVGAASDLLTPQQQHAAANAQPAAASAGNPAPQAQTQTQTQTQTPDPAAAALKPDAAATAVTPVTPVTPAATTAVTATPAAAAAAAAPAGTTIVAPIDTLPDPNAPAATPTWPAAIAPAPAVATAAPDAAQIAVDRAPVAALQTIGRIQIVPSKTESGKCTVHTPRLTRYGQWDGVWQEDLLALARTSADGKSWAAWYSGLPLNDVESSLKAQSETMVSPDSHMDLYHLGWIENYFDCTRVQKFAQALNATVFSKGARMICRGTAAKGFSAPFWEQTIYRQSTQYNVEIVRQDVSGIFATVSLVQSTAKSSACAFALTNAAVSPAPYVNAYQLCLTQAGLEDAEAWMLSPSKGKISFQTTDGKTFTQDQIACEKESDFLVGK